MAWQVFQAVFRAQVGGTKGRKIVALALADAADKDGRRAFPGRERLRQYTELGDRQVVDHINSLLEDGIIRREARGHTGQRAAFAFNLDRLAELTPEGAVERTQSRDESTRHGAPSHGEEGAVERTQSEKEGALERVDWVRYSSKEGAVQRTPPVLTHPRTTLLGPAPPSREEVFDALAAAVGWGTASLTKSERGKLNAAVKELRALDPAPTLEQIRRSGDRYCKMHPSWGPPTPHAIASNWSSLAGTKDTPAVSDKRAQLLVIVETFFGADAERAIEATLPRAPLEGNTLADLGDKAWKVGTQELGIEGDEAAFARWRDEITGAS